MTTSTLTFTPSMRSTPSGTVITCKAYTPGLNLTMMDSWYFTAQCNPAQYFPISIILNEI